MHVVILFLKIAINVGTYISSRAGVTCIAICILSMLFTKPCSIFHLHGAYICGQMLCLHSFIAANDRLPV